MSVPTVNQLATAVYDLQLLAHNDPEQFRLIAAVLDKLQWGYSELAHHKAQAGHRRTSEVAPVGAGNGSSVEAQFAGHSTPTRMYPTDPMVKALQIARRAATSIVAKADYDLERAMEPAGYPRRSVPEGWRVG